MKTFTFEIEISRRNVTPAQFLAYVRSRVDAKGGEYIRSDLDLDYFKAGNDLNFDFVHEDGLNAGTHEKSVSKPYEMQTFIKHPDGTVYNEICEFQFDDDKKGYGYYYLLNVIVEEDVPADVAVQTIKEEVEKKPTASAWERGVKAYAVELLDDLAEAVSGGWIGEDEFSSRKLLEKAMLNGASDWAEFSEGGCSLIYDTDIAERLCNASELKRTDNGYKEPNSRERWIDVQSRALFQASQLILRTAF